ncbi:MAG: nucleotidyltransferase domain-containing protein [Desulfomonilia bacterium]
MAALHDINTIARRIATEYHPDKIALFGSYAHGAPHEDSDVDMLLVILPFEEKGGVKKIVDIFRRVNPDLPFDLIVHTPSQIAEGLALGDFFLKEIMEKSKVLYEAAH